MSKGSKKWELWERVLSPRRRWVLAVFFVVLALHLAEAFDLSLGGALYYFSQ